MKYSDLYFSKEIQDPYRWLEDDLDKETKSWIEDQNLFTDKYFESLGLKAQIKKEELSISELIQILISDLQTQTTRAMHKIHRL